MSSAGSTPITVTLISVIIWAWVLGSPGGVLAIRLSLLGNSVLIDADRAPFGARRDRLEPDRGAVPVVAYTQSKWRSP